MLERDPKTLARLQAVVTALIEHRVATSLADVEKALAKWRSGQHSALAAHGATLRHAARCERTVERVTAAAGDRPEGILRDAVDAGLMTEEEFVEIVGKPSADVPSIDALVDEEDASAPDKKKTLEALLLRGPVLVHVDARRSEVAVPPRFRSDASLVLRFGYNLTPSIADLTVDDEGIGGTLTFGGSPFRVLLPWTAVYAAMVEGEQRGTVWPEDVPEDVLTGSGDGPATTTAVTTTPTSAPAPVTPVAPEEPAPRAKRASHLKLVE
ncbi:MAG TPA: ClpXP protease specificity-enhancing factor SspB [Kofleriaceae bacterium]|jgi:stringent starvation protein B